MPVMYFITVCIIDKMRLLGSIIVDGDYDTPKMILSEYETILDKYIKLMSTKYDHIIRG